MSGLRNASHVAADEVEDGNPRLCKTGLGNVEKLRGLLKAFEASYLVK